MRISTVWAAAACWCLVQASLWPWCAPAAVASPVADIMGSGQPVTPPPPSDRATAPSFAAADQPPLPAARDEGPPRTHRGGSWSNEAAGCSSSQRNRNASTTRSPLIGFRVVAAPAEGGADEGPPSVRNPLGMEFRRVPAGTVMLGGGPERRGTPPRRVTIEEPYYVGTYEVTNAQWKQVMGSLPGRWHDDDRPVEHVSWHDANEFCRRLSAMSADQAAGLRYRLPTEAEWEHACRAGSETRYCFGDDEADLPDHGWFSRNAASGPDAAAADDDVRGTQPVGQKKPNAWRLYDMHGNVSEWCAETAEVETVEAVLTDFMRLMPAQCLAERAGGFVPADAGWLALAGELSPPVAVLNAAPPPAATGGVTRGMAALALLVPATLISVACASRSAENRFAALTWLSVWIAMLLMFSTLADDTPTGHGDIAGVHVASSGLDVGIDTSETIVPIPEPSAVILALAGVACGGLTAWGRGRRAASR